MNSVSKTGEDVIVSCRRGPKTQKPKEYILRFPGIESVGGAARLLGRKVGWPVGKHEARGKIVALHGKNGLVSGRYAGPSAGKSSRNNRMNHARAACVNLYKQERLFLIRSFTCPYARNVKVSLNEEENMGWKRTS